MSALRLEALFGDHRLQCFRQLAGIAGTLDPLGNGGFIQHEIYEGNEPDLRIPFREAVGESARLVGDHLGQSLQSGFQGGGSARYDARDSSAVKHRRLSEQDRQIGIVVLPRTTGGTRDDWKEIGNQACSILENGQHPLDFLWP